jgi:hypothetical protein
MASFRRRTGGGGPERVAENWDRLVRAALKRDRDQHRAGAAAAGTGLASAVPASLGRTTNIEKILQAADDIEDEDPNVARIRMLLLSRSRFAHLGFWNCSFGAQFCFPTPGLRVGCLEPSVVAVVRACLLVSVQAETPHGIL